MQENKLVSVIVPIYKVEKYIRKCIESIINQTYKNLEIILVDDGSPDRSGEICDEFSMIDERVIVMHQKNDGVSNARNSGMSVSKGDYIYFIDGDDYAEPNAIETLLVYAEKENADLVIADINIVDEEGNIIGETHGGDNEFQVFSAKEAANYFMMLDWGPWNKLYKRDVHINVKFPSHKIHEDEAIMLQLIVNSQKVLYIHKKLYNYVKRGESTTTSSYSVKKMDWFDAWLNNVEYAKRYFPTSVNKAIFKMLITAIYNFDNLVICENGVNLNLITKILDGIRKYYKDIILNIEIPFTYKLRATIVIISIHLYKSVYKNRR